MKNPRGSKAREVLGKVLPVLRTCHAAVPFSTSERYSVMGKMHAMLTFFGLPSVFYTVAPNDVDNEMTLRLSRQAIKHDMTLGRGLQC